MSMPMPTPQTLLLLEPKAMCEVRAVCAVLRGGQGVLVVVVRPVSVTPNFLPLEPPSNFLP